MQMRSSARGPCSKRCRSFDDDPLSAARLDHPSNLIDDAARPVSSLCEPLQTPCEEGERVRGPVEG